MTFVHMVMVDLPGQHLVHEGLIGIQFTGVRDDN
jgi:hypothetical protein